MTTKQKKGRGLRPRIGTLFVLSVLLLGSAALRLGLEAGPALAKELLEEAGQGAETHMKAPVETAEMPQAEPNFQAMLTAFREREAVLAARETELEDRMRALEIADQAIEKKLAALQVAEEKLKATLTLADGASENDLTKLTTVYEQMKPKEAAALFEEMAPEFAAGFLARMKPDAAAAIMAGLEPNTAYTISVVMAGKNANVPKS